MAPFALLRHEQGTFYRESMTRIDVADADDPSVDLPPDADLDPQPEGEEDPGGWERSG